MLNRPERFLSRDRLHEHLAAVPAAADVKRALVRGEWLRRPPQRAEEAGWSAAAVRGILLVTATLLVPGGEAVRQAAAAVAEILRPTGRASSRVEGLNRVLRRHQARHRRLTQEMRDWKRLSWNGRRLRTGKRRKRTP